MCIKFVHHSECSIFPLIKACFWILFRLLYTESVRYNNEMDIDWVSPVRIWTNRSDKNFHYKINNSCIFSLVKLKGIAWTSSQPWFRSWLDAVRQQAINRTNVVWYLRRHLASQWDNEPPPSLYSAQVIFDTHTDEITLCCLSNTLGPEMYDIVY